MTLPRRPPIVVGDAGITRIVERLQTHAPGIELGWSLLKLERAHAGYTSDTPAGDRKAPSFAPGGEQSAIDYSDPTGDLAMRLGALNDDLDTLQSHRHLIETSLAAIARITARYRDLVPADPVCAVKSCDSLVERTRDGSGYRGCVLIEGIWCVRRGTESLAVCSAHRKSRERRAA